VGMPPVGTGKRSLRKLDGELKLNRLGLARPRGARWPLAELVTGSDSADALLELALVLLRWMRAAAVERGVPGDHRGELRREEVVVVLLDLRVDLQRAMPERGRAGLARGARGRVERFLAIADPRQYRHAEDRRVDARFAQHAQRPEPLTRRRRARIGLAHDLLVDARDAEVHS